jgi:hypothetical protein
MTGDRRSNSLLSTLGRVLVWAGMAVLLGYFLIVVLISFILLLPGLTGYTLVALLVALPIMAVGFVLLATTGKPNLVMAMHRTGRVLGIGMAALVAFALLGGVVSGDFDPRFLVWIATMAVLALGALFALRIGPIGGAILIFAAAVAIAIGVIAPNPYNRLLMEPGFALVGALLVVSHLLEGSALREPEERHTGDEDDSLQPQERNG